MTNKIITTIFAVIALSACSGKTTTNTTGATASNDGKICKYEKATGTKIGTKICRTRAQMESEREAAKQAMKTLTRGQTKSTN